MENFNDLSETGYGVNDNGTDMTRNDYLATNPDTTTDDYEQTIREAEKEKEDEIRNLYPGEYEENNSGSQVETQLKKTIETIRNDIDRLDALITSSYKEAKRNEAPAVTDKNAEDKSIGAVTLETDNFNRKPETTTGRFIDSHGVVHTNLEELRDAEEGYK